MLECEEVLQIGEFALDDIGDTGLGHRTLKHVLVTGVAEEPQVA